MPDADRGLAHECFERFVVVHHLVEGKSLDHEIVDHVAPECRRPVEQGGHRLGQPLVLGVDHADLAHPVAVGGGEGNVRHLPERISHLHRGHQLKTAHQPVEVALVGKQVELDDRLASPVARGELDLAGLGVGLVDEGEQRADLLAHRVPGRFAGHGHEHVALGNAGQVRRIAQADVDVPPRMFAQARAALDEGGQRNRGMVHQPLADAGQARDDGNAEFGELTHRPDAGPHQMSGRVYGAAGQDDLAATELLLLAADHRRHADAARALEQQRHDLGVGRDREVGALARLGVEIAHRRRHPPFLGVGMGDGEVAFDELAVLVGQELEALFLERLADRLGVAAPVLARNAADRYAALLAVQRSVEVEVALDLLEVGQHVVPAPAGGTSRLPIVIVGGRAAIGHLAVDRRAAAQHAGLLVLAQRRPVLLRIVVTDDLGMDFELGPMEARVEIGRAGIAVGDFRRLLARRRVLACFAQQDLVAAPGREPMGHDRAGRAAAHDNVIVHRAFPLFVGDTLARLQADVANARKHCGTANRGARSPSTPNRRRKDE